MAVRSTGARRRASVLAGVLVCLACASGQETPASARPSARSDPHFSQRHAEIATLPGRDSAELVFLGDSITERWDSDGRYVWNRYYGKRQALNMGVGGDRTENLLWRIGEGAVAGLHPRLVVVLIGTNNLLVHSDADVVRGVAAVARSLHWRLPETPVLLLGLLPRGARADDPMRARVAAVNRSLAELHARDGVHFLDVGKSLVESDGQISREVMPDFLHLSPRGYRRLAEAIEPELARLLGAEPLAPE